MTTDVFILRAYRMPTMIPEALYLLLHEMMTIKKIREETKSKLTRPGSLKRIAGGTRPPKPESGLMTGTLELQVWQVWGRRLRSGGKLVGSG